MIPPFRNLWHRIVLRLDGVTTALLAAWIALAAAIWAFLALAGEVQEGEANAFDRWVVLALRQPGHPHQIVGPPWLIEAVRDVTALGSVVVLLLISTIATIALLVHGRRLQAGLFATAVIFAEVSTDLFKALLARARPDFAVLGALPASHSFPSGHSTVATATYFLLAMIVARLELHRNAKVLAFATAAFLALAIGFSRVFLGVHWASDVIAGWLLGASWALVMSIVLGALENRQRRPSPSL
jgi:undecaprenyl-diphosphatase